MKIGKAVQAAQLGEKRGILGDRHGFCAHFTKEATGEKRGLSLIHVVCPLFMFKLWCKMHNKALVWHNIAAMKLYHFISEKYGLEAIEKQRLKASTLDDLNDPFELFAIDMSSSREFREALKMYKSYLTDKWCLLCFSKTWRSPLLWSHYAERHKGMALVFEVPEAFVDHINYRKQRIKINEAKIEDEDTTKRLLTTKYIEWAYENEARVFKSVSDAAYEENLPFIHFDSTLKLKSVILGPLSETSDSQIEERLPPSFGVSVIRSRMAFREFNIVRNKLHPVRQLKGAEQAAPADG